MLRWHCVKCPPGSSDAMQATTLYKFFFFVSTNRSPTLEMHSQAWSKNFSVFFFFSSTWRMICKRKAGWYSGSMKSPYTFAYSYVIMLKSDAGNSSKKWLREMEWVCSCCLNDFCSQNVLISIVKVVSVKASPPCTHLSPFTILFFHLHSL